MRRLAAFLIVLFVPLVASSATLLAAAETRRTLIRATGGEVASLDPASLRVLWSAEGVRDPKLLVLSADARWAAAIDPIANRLALVDLTNGATERIDVPETPLAATFHQGALFVLSRDAALLSRIDPADASIRSVDAPAAASHLLVTQQGAFAYSPLTGEIARFDRGTLRQLAKRTLPRFGSDLATEGASGYLVEPRTGRLSVFSLETLAISEQRSAGAVPVDIEIAAPANPTRGTQIAIADPSAKRVWRDEGAQSTAAAVGRGFLRGLLGIGLYNPGSTGFPTGVDRIETIGGRVFAYDTSTGTLWITRGDRAVEVATGIAWGSFAPLGDAVFIARETDVERVSLP